MAAKTPDRMVDQRALWVEYADFYRILGGLGLVALGVLLGATVFGDDPGYSTNLYTEFVSIAVTVFVLDFVSRRRDEQQRIDELKERLKRRMRSRVNSEARRATEELRDYGWLMDGTLCREHFDKADLQHSDLMEANLKDCNLQGALLQEARLMYANLENARLQYAHLDGAMLFEANLSNANLSNATLVDCSMHEANLTGANLSSASLQGIRLEGARLNRAKLVNVHLRDAKLEDADLSNAILFGADLMNSNLSRANLCGANLKLANLQGVRWFDAKTGIAQMDADTILPDGERYDPAQGLQQMDRFTDRSHPEFWSRWRD